MLPVFDIQRLRFGVDGDGVRTLVGLAGCGLRCRYCLNPHSWNGSVKVTGYTPEELYEIVRVDDLYFRTTGGGVTFGGGESLLHMDAICRFAQLCPGDWSLWAETSLSVPEENVIQAANVLHHLLVDIKTMNPKVYRDYTGADPELTYRNLQLLLKLVGPRRITVRLPMIPGFTTGTQVEKSAQILREMGVQDLDYLTYETQIL